MHVLAGRKDSMPGHLYFRLSAVGAGLSAHAFLGGGFLASLSFLGRALLGLWLGHEGPVAFHLVVVTNLVTGGFVDEFLLVFLAGLGPRSAELFHDLLSVLEVVVVFLGDLWALFLDEECVGRHDALWLKRVLLFLLGFGLVGLRLDVALHFNPVALTVAVGLLLVLLLVLVGGLPPQGADFLHDVLLKFMALGKSLLVVRNEGHVRGQGALGRVWVLLSAFAGLLGWLWGGRNVALHFFQEALLVLGGLANEVLLLLGVELAPSLTAVLDDGGALGVLWEGVRDGLNVLLDEDHVRGQWPLGTVGVLLLSLGAYTRHVYMVCLNLF